MKSSYVCRVGTVTLELDPLLEDEYLPLCETYLGVAAHESLETLQSNDQLQAIL